MAGMVVEWVRFDLNRLLFLGFTFFGSLLLIILRGVMHLGPWPAITVAIMLMMIYLALVIAVPRFHLLPDQLGDNMYYLGFIYTLVSLSLSLYQFRMADMAVVQVASNFGVALGTTIVGVALRVVLHQMRTDPAQTEEEARMELADAASRLRVELDQAVTDLSIFRQGTYKSLEEGNEKLAEIIKEAMETISMRYKQALEKTTESLTETIQQFTEQSKRMNRSTRSLASAVEKLEERVSRIEVPNRLIAEKLEPVVEEAVNAIREFRQEIAQEVGHFRDVGRALTSLKEEGVEAGMALRNLGVKASSETSVAFKDLEQSIGKVTGANTEFAAALQSLADIVIETLEMRIKEDVDSIHNTMLLLAEEKDRFIDSASVRWRKILEEDAALLTKTREENQKLLLQLLDEVRDSLAQIKELKKSAIQEWEEARRLNNQLKHELIELANVMINELQKKPS